MYLSAAPLFLSILASIFVHATPLDPATKRDTGPMVYGGKVYNPYTGQSRTEFTQGTLGNYVNNYPNHTVIVINTAYEIWGPNQWIHETAWFQEDRLFHKDISYDVLVFTNGTFFKRKGDGGSKNWGWHLGVGCVVSEENTKFDCWTPWDPPIVLDDPRAAVKDK